MQKAPFTQQPKLNCELQVRYHNYEGIPIDLCRRLSRLELNEQVRLSQTAGSLNMSCLKAAVRDLFQVSASQGVSFPCESLCVHRGAVAGYQDHSDMI